MINLFSDTQTKPSKEMRRAMADAQVGDEQRRLDPTVIKLEEMTASLLGKEAGLFLPSGTMCNIIAVKVHTQPGDAILADRMSHILRAELGGAAFHSGVTIDQLDGQRGIFNAEQVEEGFKRVSYYSPPVTLVCVENTHNYGGGTIWPVNVLQEVCQLANRLNRKTHMDGARLFNACVAAGISAAEYSRPVDSVWIDLSKGLGCPVGAVLAGTKEFISKARRYKHIFGGAMRQAGIIAAAGVYALEHNIERLADDHANAKLLARGLSQIKGIKLDPPEPQTNIIYFDTRAAGLSNTEFIKAMDQQDISMSGIGQLVRAVTHLDVSRADCERAVEAAAGCLARR
ncbi:threonine aldolase family protein [soil metagenome]